MMASLKVALRAGRWDLSVVKSVVLKDAELVGLKAGRLAGQSDWWVEK